jgi:hypothetical protein
MEKFKKEAGSQDNARETVKDILEEPIKGSEEVSTKQFKENAPKDAFGCDTIQTLNEFIDQQRVEGLNPKE